MALTNEIYEWEGDDTQPYESNIVWKHRRFLVPNKLFSAARVIAEFDDREDYAALLEARAEAIKRNMARLSSGVLLSLIGEDEIGDTVVNGDTLEDVPTVGDYSGDNVCIYRFYVDDEVVFTKEVYDSKPFRITQQRGLTVAHEVEANIIVKDIRTASSMQELKEEATQQPTAA